MIEEHKMKIEIGFGEKGDVLGTNWLNSICRSYWNVNRRLICEIQVNRMLNRLYGRYKVKVF